MPQESGKPVTDVAELAKPIDEFKALLDKLPTPPTKEADEKCGDQDCYHVSLKLTADDLKALDPTATATDGDFSLDLWTRKNDRLPAKITLSVTAPDDRHRRHDVRLQVRRQRLGRGPARGPDRSVTTHPVPATNAPRRYRRPGASSCPDEGRVKAADLQ